MKEFVKNKNLKTLNTFGIAARAQLFMELESEEELEWLIKQKEFLEQPVLWLGGGSNILLRQNFKGLVIKLSLKGKSLKMLNEDEAMLYAAAGENWHQLVVFALQNDLGGLENLSLIPGNAGTAPIQNIGAYGVELQDCFESLRAFDLREEKFVEFSHEDCQFDYRNSIFKNSGKGRYIITEIRLKLSRKEHRLHTGYGSLKNELEHRQLPATIHNISQAVIAIRQSKLPDPSEIGNSGSFFKNPLVNHARYRELKMAYPAMPAFRISDNDYKLAAGWLIEQAGWKGYRKGDAGVHNKQALVLVNYGKARGTEIEALAKAIKDSVFLKFAVQLEAEVNII